MLFFSGFVGLIGGFAIGLYVIRLMLRGKSSKELFEDKSIRWKYGSLVWAISILSSYICLKMYEYYLL